MSTHKFSPKGSVAGLRPRAIVAGGAGFIGSHLCEYLLEKNFYVICVDNLLTGSMRNIKHLLSNPYFRFHRADVTRPLSLRGRAEVIFNLASPASPWDYLRLPLQTLAAGSLGTRNLLDLAVRKEAVFVLASTSEVYGDPEVHPQQENYRGNVNPVGVRSCYDEAKRYAEALTMAYHRKYGLSTRIARIFNTYGPRMKPDDGRVIPDMIMRALRGRPLRIFGNGMQTRSFCYVTDMVEGLFRLTRCPDPMPINLGSPEETTILGLAQILGRALKRKIRMRFLPALEDDPRKRKPDISRAMHLLSWKPSVPLKQGLASTIDWFRSIYT
ncbi:MAG: UDP-glucuronic acid decarboxylase family protein [candidate division WOR-3 bacterium]